ncbi:Fic family protein [Carboxylicivirga sp. M1479]|uniref:Fic/DOC family protein n=1 Tax=Carboxylicivirga sp. M1479 TaxID=2594476 RepID=UPI0011774891|nr:Fic family protein [Carboxylicivirga sp. M1479]TRX70919.1 cell filamentation protein Fic [Carboxylicivirga sp. M1479]
MPYLHSKYEVPGDDSQHEVLPNLLGITSIKAIHKVEFEGFLKAQYLLIDELTTHTVFNFEYIKHIHQLSLLKVYDFAGQFRTVNMTKGGFLFPTAKFLPTICHDFDEQILQKLPNHYDNKEKLIADIAKVHAELLFIHPFREANGRVARVLANMMAIKQGYDFLDFYKITQRQFEEYIMAVQSAADQNYQPMTKIISAIF